MEIIMEEMLRPLILLIIGMFYAIYFAKRLIQVVNGTKTNVMGKGNKSNRTIIVERILGVLTPSIVAVQLVSIVLDLHFFSVETRYTGILVALVGTIIFSISIITMKDNWRVGVPEDKQTNLVDKGIYRYSRNPAFLGFDLLYIGILISYFNWVLLIVTIITIVMFHFQILEEEKFLEEKFGDEYLSYKNEAFRYLGRRKNKI